MVIFVIGVIKGDVRYNVFKGKDNYIVSNNLNDFVNIDTLILPFSGIDSYYNIKGTNLNLVDIIRNNKIDKIFTGNSSKLLDELCSSLGIILYEFLKDDDFIISNSIYTAAGIIDYLQKSGKCVSDMCIFIMGYGNISSSLARLLEAYKAKFVIYPNNKLEKKYILLDRYEVGNISNLDKYDYIINTIPFNYLGDYSVFKGCNILDVSSSPYGFDVDKLDKTNVNYYIYSSIPSKYLCLSSGNLVYNFVKKHLQN